MEKQIIVSVLLAGLLFFGAVSAQGGSQNGGMAPSGQGQMTTQGPGPAGGQMPEDMPGSMTNGNGEQTQGNEGLQPQQDRDQNQSQEQLQEQSRLEDGTGEGEQNRVREEEMNMEHAGESDDGEMQENKRQMNIQEHRSVVAECTQRLIAAAENIDSEIGQQIRQIAQEQERVSEETAAAIETAQNENGFKMFFFGPNYSNLKQLQSQTQTSREQLQELQNLLENIDKEEIRQEVQDQITLLKSEQEEIENLITEKEQAFSLFGWLAKMFAN